MHRFQQIDILRALAVFLVLGRHLIPYPPGPSPFLFQATSTWARGGWVGVDLFFVLSGFLVSGLLFREYEKYGRLHIGRFLIRRGFKIYPPFWLLIGATVLALFLHDRDVPIRALLYELFFIQNYGPSLWNHTWSLAIEEHFYFLLAAGLLALTWRRTTQPFRVIPAVFVSAALLCLLLRVVLSLNVPYSHKTHSFPTHLRLDGLLFGVFLSYLFYRRPTQFLSVARRYRFALLTAGVLLLLPAFIWQLEKTRFIFTYGLTLFYLGSGCLLVAALGFQAPESRWLKATAYVGSHSYSVYLWHMPVAAWLSPAVGKILQQHYNWYHYAAVNVGGAIVIGVVMSLIIEFPILRIRDRWFPSRGTPLSITVTDPP